MFYDGDGFWALQTEARAGLAALAVFSGGLAIVLVRALASAVPLAPLRVVVGLGLALAAHAAFLWLSPQLFHAYLDMAAPDRAGPRQPAWPPPGLGALTDRVADALTFAEAGLADHARGLLGWLMLLAGASAPGRTPRQDDVRTD